MKLDRGASKEVSKKSKAASKKRKSQFLSLEKIGDHVDFIKAVTIEVYSTFSFCRVETMPIKQQSSSPSSSGIEF